MVTNKISGRTWFGSHNCAREFSFVQSVLSGCLVLSPIQCVPVVLSAGKYPSEVEVSGRSPSSAFAENSWR